MQLQKMSSQMPVSRQQTSFKGTFNITDPRVLSLCKNEYSEDMLNCVQKITGKYLTKLGMDAMTLKSLPEHDMSVFAQLKELGLKFKAIIGED